MADKRPKGPPRGDSPYNLRNERGSKQSCLVRVAELVGFGGIVAVTVSAALAGRTRR
jgi:hypothetical protein